MSVDIEIHSFEMTFDNLGFKVGHRTSGVCLDCSLCILHHHHTILVVGICNGKSRLGQ